MQLCKSSGSKHFRNVQQILSEDACLAEQELTNHLWEEAMRKRATENTTLYLKIDRKPYAKHFGVGHIPLLSIQEISLKQDVARVIWEMASRLQVQTASRKCQQSYTTRAYTKIHKSKKAHNWYVSHHSLEFH